MSPPTLRTLATGFAGDKNFEAENARLGEVADERGDESPVCHRATRSRAAEQLKQIDQLSATPVNSCEFQQVATRGHYG